MAKKTTAQIREEITTAIYEVIEKGCPELFTDGAFVFHGGKKQFAIPMGTDDAPQACALISVTVPQWKDTSKSTAFDLGFAEDELKMREKEKEEKAAEKERIKAEKLALAQKKKEEKVKEKEKLQEKLKQSEEEVEEE